jgi:AraC-like DNA-binding protein
MSATTTAIFNADEFEAALQQGGSVELLITGRGQFQAQLTRIVLPRLCLLRGEEWLSRIAVVSVASDSILIVLPTEQGSSQIWGGAVMQAGEIMTVGPGGRVHVRTNGPCRWGTMCVSTTELMRYGCALIGPEFACLPGVRRWRPTRTSIRELMGLFNTAVHLTGARPSMPIETQAAHELKQELIHALIGCLRTGSLETDVTPRLRRAAIMIRLEDLLQTHPSRFPRITEVCRALGISQGGLKACCKEQVGISPSRYFRLGKMRRVHRALISADPDTASVSQLAKFYGFNELGRFAGVYRKFFGELPSATLRHGTGVGWQPTAIRQAPDTE